MVDGYSTDDTLETARKLRPDVRIVMQNRRGKGNALAWGFAAAVRDIQISAMGIMPSGAAMFLCSGSAPNR